SADGIVLVRDVSTRSTGCEVTLTPVDHDVFGILHDRKPGTEGTMGEIHLIATPERTTRPETLVIATQPQERGAANDHIGPHTPTVNGYAPSSQPLVTSWFEGRDERLATIVDTGRQCPKNDNSVWLAREYCHPSTQPVRTNRAVIIR